MKFRINDVEPSNEELLLGASMIIGAFVLAIIGGKIRDWMEARKHGKKTPIDRINEAYNVIKLPIPDEYEIPQVSDPQYAGKKLNCAHHGVDFQVFIQATTKLNDTLNRFVTSDDVTVLSKLLKDIQKVIPVYRDEKNGSLTIEFPDRGLVWPSDPFYKDLKECNSKFESIMSRVKDNVKKLRDKCDKIITSSANEKDEQELKKRAAIITMCDCVSFLASGTYLGYIANLQTIEDETEIVD